MEEEEDVGNIMAHNTDHYDKGEEKDVAQIERLESQILKPYSYTHQPTHRQLQPSQAQIIKLDLQDNIPNLS